MWKLKRLTAREREGLLLVGAGVGNRERQRSRELGIAERKATAHIARIVEKLGQWSRLQVAVLAAVLSVLPILAVLGRELLCEDVCRAHRKVSLPPGGARNLTPHQSGAACVRFQRTAGGPRLPSPWGSDL
ncbi:LuxR C-terminal-related transcriptional regulator [Streptomyces decoyicus]|uniref:LuxR C-terminal-related transcriptional regulator n=1 Tax=Streptomyces decoyicus TaxID=249567 RepID=UPI0038687CF2